MDDINQPSPQQPKSYHLAAKGGRPASDSPALSPSPEQHRRRAFTEDDADASQATGSTGIDLHQEIALAVRQAIATHNSAYQSALTRSEEQWRHSKEEALLAAEERFEQRLEEVKLRFQADHVAEKDDMQKAVRLAQEDQTRLKQELVSAQATIRKLQQYVDEHRDSTVSLSAVKQQLLARELQLQAKDMAHKDALRTQKMTFDAALSRAEAQLRREQEHVSVAVALRETEVRTEYAGQADALQQAHTEELQRLKEEAEERIQQLQDELAAEREAHDLTLNTLEKLKLKAMRAVGSSSVSKGAQPASPAQVQGGVTVDDALAGGSGVVTSPLSPANAEFMSTLKALRQQSAAKVAGDPSASGGGPSTVALRLLARSGAGNGNAASASSTAAAVGSLAAPETELMRLAASVDVDVDDAEVLGAGASLSGSVEIAPDGAVGPSLSPRLAGSRDVPHLIASSRGGVSAPSSSVSLSPQAQAAPAQGMAAGAAVGGEATIEGSQTSPQPPPPAGRPPTNAPMEGTNYGAGGAADEEEDQDDVDLLHAELLRLQAQLTQTVAGNRSLAAQLASAQGEVAFAAAVRPMLDALKEEFASEVQRGEALQGALTEATEMVSQLREQVAAVQAEAEAQAGKAAADYAALVRNSAEELAQVKASAQAGEEKASAVIAELTPKAQQAEGNRALVIELRSRLAHVMHAFAVFDTHKHAQGAGHLAISDDRSPQQHELWTGSIAPVLASLSDSLQKARPAMDKIAAVSQALVSKSDKLITASEALLDNTFSADPFVDIRFRPSGAGTDNGAGDNTASAAGAQLIKDVASRFAAMRDLSLAAVRQSIETLYPLAGMATSGTGPTGAVQEMTLAEGCIERPERPIVPATLACMIASDALQQAQALAESSSPDLSLEVTEHSSVPPSTGLEDALHAIASAAEQALSIQTAAQFDADSFSGQDLASGSVSESAVVSAWARQYSALLALLALPEDDAHTGSTLLAARACVDFLDILASSSTSVSAQRTVQFLQGLLDEHWRGTLKQTTKEIESNAVAVMLSQSPRQGADTSSSTPGPSTSDVMGQLLSSLSSMRESVIAVERKHSAMLAQAAVNKEAAAAALTAATRVIASRDQSIVEMQSRAIEELQRHETSLLASDAAVQALLQLEAAVHDLQSRVELERSTYLHRRTAWAEATSVLVSALQALEAQLATLQRFEEARAPYIARAAIITSGLPATSSARPAELMEASRKASLDSAAAYTAKTGAEGSAASAAGKTTAGGSVASQRSTALSHRPPASVSGQSVPLELSQPSMEAGSLKADSLPVQEASPEEERQVAEKANGIGIGMLAPQPEAVAQPAAQSEPTPEDDATAISKALALIHGGPASLAGHGALGGAGRSPRPPPQSMVSSFHSLSSTYATSAYLNNTLANGSVAFSSPSASRSLGYFGPSSTMAGAASVAVVGGSPRGIGGGSLMGVTSPTYRPTTMAAALPTVSSLGSPVATTFSPRVPGRLPPATPL